ncbi:MAG: metallophosphoesterase family protein [bacterium]
MKILAIGDIHGEKRIIRKTLSLIKNENPDLIILAGDMTFIEQDIEKIMNYFGKIKKEILVIPGNHETPESINTITKKHSNIKNIHGNYFIKDNIGFFGAGGGDVVLHVINENDIEKLLKKGHEKLKNIEKKVMITHMHPKGSKSEFTGFQGFKSITKAIYDFEPDLVLNAHIHEAGGAYDKFKKTRVINVSRNPAIIEI